MATDKRFVAGDLVLVKFPGYGYWPAKIVAQKITADYKKGGRKIVCFGENEKGFAYIADMKYYDESSKMKYISKTSLKKYPHLTKALEQISLEFRNGKSVDSSKTMRLSREGKNVQGTSMERIEEVKGPIDGVVDVSKEVPTNENVKESNLNSNDDDPIELAKKRKTGPDEQSQANLPDKCFTCRQRTSEVKTIELPTSGVKEEAAIDDSSIRIVGDDNAALQFKLTNFTVFDRSGHIVPIFAPDLINKYKKLYFSGKVQSIIADDDDSDGVDIIEAGPIVEWTNGAGHDTIKEDIMLNTKVNGRDIEYHLVSPSDDYREVYESVYRMVYMSNKIITELCDRNERNELMEYAELLEFVANMPAPLLQGKPLQAIDEEAVQKYADFLVMQATSFEDADDVGDDLSIMGMPCIKHLSDMAGVDRSRKEPEVHHQRERSTQSRD